MQLEIEIIGTDINGQQFKIEFDTEKKTTQITGTLYQADLEFLTAIRAVLSNFKDRYNKKG